MRRSIRIIMNLKLWVLLYQELQTMSDDFIDGFVGWAWININSIIV